MNSACKLFHFVQFHIIVTLKTRNECQDKIQLKIFLNRRAAKIRSENDTEQNERKKKDVLKLYLVAMYARIWLNYAK